MSLTIARNNVARTQKAIADLQKQDAAEAKKEATETAKLNRAQNGASRAGSTSTRNMKIREMERAQSNLASIQSKRASLAQKISQKMGELHRYQAQCEREEKREADRLAKEQKKVQDDLIRRQRQLDQHLSQQGAASRMSAPIPTSDTYDVFVSHASEDKDSFVRPFAEELRDLGLSVWYDEFELGWGDGLRQKIDKGLASSRFGVVVLSEHFFAKEWPQKELDGLFAQEMGGDTRILPIWHKITKDEVRRHSPLLADKLAMNTTDMDFSEIAQKLKKMCRDG